MTDIEVRLNEKDNIRKIKCVVWDLDNTIWNGVLLEESNVTLRKGVVDIIKELDKRGVLHSISSRNNYEQAMEKINELGLDEYFIYPQINWNPKSQSIKRIAESINIATDTLAFIDDQEFEREEVNYILPEVLCIDAGDISGLLEMPEMNPRFITEDSAIRRKLYLSDIIRKKAEEEFEGHQEEFLSSLGMVFKISPVQEGDLQRAEELTVRTHQLNTTGYTYSYEELDNFRNSDRHKMFIASLEDKFGEYGKIGLALVECNDSMWYLKLLLMSCRVMSRGVGSVMLNHVMNLAKESGVSLRAEFVPNNRNRIMYITYKFAGFKEVGVQGDVTILQNDMNIISPFPAYIQVIVE